MKRYIIEMSNDFEKKVIDEKQIEIIKIRNAYICQLIAETDAIQAMLNIFYRYSMESEVK